MTENKKENGGKSIDNIVDQFFENVEAGLRSIGSSFNKLLSGVVDIKFSKIFEQEKEIMKDRIKKTIIGDDNVKK